MFAQFIILIIHLYKKIHFQIGLKVVAGGYSWWQGWSVF